MTTTPSQQQQQQQQELFQFRLPSSLVSSPAATTSSPTSTIDTVLVVTEDEEVVVEEEEDNTITTIIETNNNNNNDEFLQFVSSTSTAASDHPLTVVADDDVNIPFSALTVQENHLKEKDDVVDFSYDADPLLLSSSVLEEEEEEEDPFTTTATAILPLLLEPLPLPLTFAVVAAEEGEENENDDALLFVSSTRSLPPPPPPPPSVDTDDDDDDDIFIQQLKLDQLQISNTQNYSGSSRSSNNNQDSTATTTTTTTTTKHHQHPEEPIPFSDPEDDLYNDQYLLLNIDNDDDDNATFSVSSSQSDHNSPSFSDDNHNHVLLLPHPFDDNFIDNHDEPYDTNHYDDNNNDPLWLFWNDTTTKEIDATNHPTAASTSIIATTSSTVTNSNNNNSNTSSNENGDRRSNNSEQSHGSNNRNNNDNDDKHDPSNSNYNSNDNSNNNFGGEGPNAAPFSGDNDDHPLYPDNYYCQFCDDPNAIVPTVSTMMMMMAPYYENNNSYSNPFGGNYQAPYNNDGNDTLAWAYATQSVYADEYNHQNHDMTTSTTDIVNHSSGIAASTVEEQDQMQQQQQQRRRDEEQFWQQQYQSLVSDAATSSLSLLSPSPAAFVHKSDTVQVDTKYPTERQEEEEDEEKVNVIDETVIHQQTPYHDDQPQRQQQESYDYSPEIIASSIPYISAFQATFVHETHTIRQSLQEYDAQMRNSNSQPQQPQSNNKSSGSNTRVCYGHTERILGCDVSLDNKYMATASQDSTIRIWNIATQKCIHTIRDHNKQYECLRVTFSDTNHFGGGNLITGADIESLLLPQINDDENSKIEYNDDVVPPVFMYLLATGGADGMVHIYGCTHPDDRSAEWKQLATVNHSSLKHIVQKQKLDVDMATKKNARIETIHERSNENSDIDDEEEGDDTDGAKTSKATNHEIDYTPQIYALQFIDHWDALLQPVNNAEQDQQNTSPVANHKNSFLLTSSEDYIHIWEMIVLQVDMDGEQERRTTSTYLPKKIKHKIGDDGSEAGSFVNDCENDVQPSTTRKKRSEIQLREVLSIHFGSIHLPAFGVQICSVATTNNDGPSHPQPQQHVNSCPNYSETFTFGGERNPDNVIYVFDASYCTVNGILGVALSDGTLRLMNGRGVCLSVLQLPGQQSHLTSFHWDSGGRRLATTVATGHLVIWDIEIINPLGVVGYHDSEYSHSLVSAGIRTSCRAVLDGGHVVGRPLYGCRFIAQNDELLISYGSDGRICLWDSISVGEIHEPISLLWENEHNTTATSEGYPIFALGVVSPIRANKKRNQIPQQKSPANVRHGSADESSSDSKKSERVITTSTIVIAGGGSSPGGILGVPVYLQDVYISSYHVDDDDDEQ